MATTEHATRRPLHGARIERGTAVTPMAAGGEPAPGSILAAAAYEDDQIVSVETLCVGEAR
jgi:hypothetical protein